MKKTIFLISCSVLMLASCGGRSSSVDFKTNKDEEAPADKMAAMPELKETVKFSPPAVSDESSADLAGGNSGTTESSTVGLTAAAGVPIPVKIAEKIKKTADLDISVDDYKVARAAIEKVVKSGNAYIGGENEQNSTYSITNSMVIRVSNKDFDRMVSNLAAVASHVNSKNIYMEDVTAQFVDITARLKTKKEVEKRYLDLLQKAMKVSDILEVEGQLRVIREEIEAKEGELKYLNDQVDYSTINLNFHQNFEFTPQDEPGFVGRIGHAFGNGWKGFLTLIIGCVYVWPLWLILGLTAYILVRFIKKKLKK
ncbi:MAG: DUF4349 domain-containing protein [Bacteroidetes bacterium]|nr:DUF4349 domain-containing protein [Bacteroidota bacterium]